MSGTRKKNWKETLHFRYLAAITLMYYPYKIQNQPNIIQIKSYEDIPGYEPVESGDEALFSD